MKGNWAGMLVLGLGLGLVGLGLAASLRAQEKAEPAEKKDTDAEQDSRQQLLQTVGVLAAGHLYQCYLNIGFIADGKAEETYEDEDIQPILASVLALMDSLDKQLDIVKKIEVSKEDQKTITECRRLSGLLRKQAEELQAFWKTGDKKHGDKYEEARKQAWTGISKLLDLK